MPQMIGATSSKLHKSRWGGSSACLGMRTCSNVFLLKCLLVRTGTLFGTGTGVKAGKGAETQRVMPTEYPVAGYSVFTGFYKNGCESEGISIVGNH